MPAKQYVNPDACNITVSHLISQIKKAFTRVIADTNSKSTDNKALGDSLTDDYNEFLDNLKQKLTSSEIEDIHQLDRLEVLAQDKILELTSTIRAVENWNKFIDASGERTNTIGGIRGLVTNIFQFIENIHVAERKKVNAFIDQEWQRAAEGGRSVNNDVIENARKLWVNHTAGGDELHRAIRKIGASDVEKEIFKALRDGHYKNLPELDLISRIFKNTENFVNDKLKAEFPHYKRKRQGKLPIRLDVNRMIDKQEWMAFMRDAIKPEVYLRITSEAYNGLSQHAKMTKIGEYLSQQYDEIISGNQNIFKTKTKPNNPFNPTDWEFRNTDKEYEFYKRYGDMKGGVVYQAFTNLANESGNAANQVLLGRKYEYSFVAIRDKLLQKYKDVEGVNVTEINAAMHDHLQVFQAKARPRSQKDIDFSEHTRILSQFISAGLTGLSALRNLMWDNTIHAAIVKSATDGSSFIGEFGKSLTDLTKLLVQRGQRDQLKEILESQGRIIEIAYAEIVAGSTKNDLSFRIQGKTGRISRLVSKTAENVSTFTFATATNTSARIAATINAESIMSQALKLTKFDGSDTIAALKGAGIDESMWNVLKKVKRDKRLGIVKDEAFQDLTKQDLAPIMTRYGSIQEARKQAQFLYNNVVSELTDEMATIVQYRGAITKFEDIKHPLARLFMMSTFKFGNITMSAYVGLMRAVSRHAGLDPNMVNSDIFNPVAMTLALAKKDPVYLGKLALTATAGGYMIDAMRDTIRGERPRAFTPKNLLQASQNTELYGYLGVIANNLFWGKGVVPDTTESIARFIPMANKYAGDALEGDLNFTKRNFGNELLKIKNTLPYFSMWHLSLGIDVAARKGLDVPLTRSQRKKAREDNLFRQFGID